MYHICLTFESENVLAKINSQTEEGFLLVSLGVCDSFTLKGLGDFDMMHVKTFQKFSITG